MAVLIFKATRMGLELEMGVRDVVQTVVEWLLYFGVAIGIKVLLSANTEKTGKLSFTAGFS